MKKKKFDCVRMKHKIQEEILEEVRGLSREEQRRWTEEQIMSDPLLGSLRKKIQRVYPQGAARVSS